MSDLAGPNATDARVDQELAALDERGQAALVIDASGERVLWATGAGAALFGARDARALARERLDGRAFPV
ncbi:hypothetical protein SLNSH_24085, partial [Alsobacter soli]